MKYIELTDKEKLQYLSKSKCGLYNMCPYAFYLGYIKKKKQEYNPAFNFGSQVHSFIEKFFKQVKFQNHNIIVPNLPHSNQIKNYVKNFIQFEINRWKNCVISKPNNPKHYYLPIMLEEFITNQDKKLTGVIDRLHYNFNDELVIIDNKSGKPNQEKIEKYKLDLLWYKILMKIEHKKDIYRGAIYFPQNNHVENYNLSDENAKQLFKEIMEIREKINNKEFPKNRNGCKWCNFKKWCLIE